MSGPLVTLGRPRRIRTLPGQNAHSMDHGRPGEGRTQSHDYAEILHSDQTTPRDRLPPPELTRPGKRAAPFRDRHGYLVSNASSFPQEKGSNSFRKDQGSVPSDFDLLSTTVKRISELEARVHIQAQEIQMKDQEIATLKQKLTMLQKQKAGHSSPDHQVRELEGRCQELQKRVLDMERFLNDYGLIWVGDEDSAAHVEQTNSSSSGISSQTFQPDFDLVVENLRDLNVLGGEGVSQIQYKDRAARLKRPDPISLTLYKNGIILFQGPFRSYQEASTQQCVRDIMDGYFPSELQGRFPDGVVFQVTDLRDVVFRERRSWGEFPGTGKTIGAPEDNIKETSELPGPGLTADQFLGRLPKCVVSGGRVLDIQAPIREMLKGSKGEKTHEIQVDSPHVSSMEKSSQVDVFVSTLRIKSETGDDTYLVRMLSSETLGDLRTYLSQFRTTDEAYDIVNRFPHRVYDSDACTLQEAGLVPNAFLLLRRKHLREPAHIAQLNGYNNF
ncbi:UBX domain-containing protein 11 [Hyperolius riggenbachi]|uniref:UBX domain-containing protein 11 n=1 Tax=Hyperolius riggenbachi TaxID=752182 RepID=UPI0035A398F1